jgi:hypothetical protein
VGIITRHSATHPKFLHSNSTSHQWAFGAFAELIDNAVDPDVAAKCLEVAPPSNNNPPVHTAVSRLVGRGCIHRSRQPVTVGTRPAAAKAPPTPASPPPFECPFKCPFNCLFRRQIDFINLAPGLDALSIVDDGNGMGQGCSLRGGRGAERPHWPGDSIGFPPASH